MITYHSFSPESFVVYLLTKIECKTKKLSTPKGHHDDITKNLDLHFSKIASFLYTYRKQRNKWFSLYMYIIHLHFKGNIEH
jgi:hypothetical protein